MLGDFTHETNSQDFVTTGSPGPIHPGFLSRCGYGDHVCWDCFDFRGVSRLTVRVIGFGLFARWTSDKDLIVSFYDDVVL